MPNKVDKAIKSFNWKGARKRWCQFQDPVSKECRVRSGGNMTMVCNHQDNMRKCKDFKSCTLLSVTGY